MKKIILFVAIICITHFAFAQKEHNIWYFGTNAGLDFNSGAPVAITNSVMNAGEGCSSISDVNGNLLFYTDGTTIWNKNHAVMTNGTGLTGNPTSTQSAMIVKQPGNANLYYVFTTFTTLNYSVVDINLNAGLGAVTASKNVLMTSNGSEKLCATAHTNGTDIWILAHESGTDGFNAFVLSSAGVTSIPVHSNAGLVSSGPGQMKFSPSGNRVAFGTYTGPTTYIGDFDATTGVVSGGFSITTNYNQNYGLEFSPDGNLLYTTSNPPDTIFQLNLNAGTPAAIIASRLGIGTSYPQAAASMQLGPDKKIYLSPAGSSYVDVINDPNTLGFGCNFVHNAVYLNGRVCQLGLPGSMASFYKVSGLPPVASFNSSDTAFCEEGGKCIDFFDLSTGSPTSWKWTFPGATPDTSTDQNPTNICYYVPGTYAVTLVAINSNGSDTSNVSSLIIFGSGASKPFLSISGDTIFSSHASSYQWYYNGSPIPGATDSFYVAAQGGSYNVFITDDIGCSRLGDGIVFTFINGFEPDGGIVIYPNPAQNKFTVFGLRFTVGATIDVYDAIGQGVYSTVVSGEKETIDLSDRPSGIYFVRISDAGENFTTKLIKE